MATAIILVFIAGYILIALETVTFISKTAVALLMAVVCWTLYYMGFGASPENVSVFAQTLGETSQPTLRTTVSGFSLPIAPA